MAKAQIVDFSNVKEGGNFNKKRIPAGDYAAKITKVEDAEAKDGVFQYLFSIKILSHPSSVLPYYCKLQENQLWKLRNLLIAGGKAVPKKRTKIDPNVLVGKTIGVTVEDTEYEGKDQSEIGGVFPAAELDDDAAVDDTSEDAEDTEDEAEDEAEDLDLDAGAEEAEEEPEAEEEVEEEEPEAEDEAEGDEWDAITDRLELRKALKKVAPDVKTSTTMTEDDIRDLIRQHSAAAKPVAKPAAKPAAKAAPARKPAAKKPAAAEITDDELEELDIDSI